MYSQSLFKKQLAMNHRGQGQVEYTVIVLLVTMVFWLGIRDTGIGQSLQNTWQEVGGSILPVGGGSAAKPGDGSGAGSGGGAGSGSGAGSEGGSSSGSGGSSGSGSAGGGSSGNAGGGTAGGSGSGSSAAPVAVRAVIRVAALAVAVVVRAVRAEFWLERQWLYRRFRRQLWQWFCRRW